jgi:hypothetical protein
MGTQNWFAKFLGPVLELVLGKEGQAPQDIFKIPKYDDEVIKRFGLEPGRAITVAGDWMATGPMVEQVFPSYVVTGNPQTEARRFEPRIILSEIFSKLTKSHVLFPFSEKDIHKTIANKGKYSRLLSDPFYEENILAVIEQMIDGGAIYMFPYQSFEVDFDLFEKRGLKVMGPHNLSIRDLLANKIHFYEFIERSEVEGMPGAVANNLEEALEIIKEVGGDVFVTEEVGAGGVGSYHFKSLEEAEEKLQGYTGRLLVLKWMKHLVSSQNVFAVVPRGTTRASDIAVISISDQIIEETIYGGNSFPSSLPETQFNALVKMTKSLGAGLAKQGYSGIFGLDALTVKEKGKMKVYPVELNLRVNHSHGLASFIYAKLRPSLPPAVALHAAATLTDSWIDKKELAQLPIQSKEIKPMVMRVFRLMGWQRTTPISAPNTLNVGFPPPKWIIPRTNLDSKSGIRTTNPRPVFVGRIISGGETLEEVFGYAKKTEDDVKESFEVLKHVHNSS